MPPVRPPRKGIDFTVEVKVDSMESLDKFLKMAEDVGENHSGIHVHLIVKVG